MMQFILHEVNFEYMHSRNCNNDSSSTSSCQLAKNLAVNCLDCIMVTQLATKSPKEQLEIADCDLFLRR